MSTYKNESETKILTSHEVTALFGGMKYQNVEMFNHVREETEND